jgi:hypothetical protein
LCKPVAGLTDVACIMFNAGVVPRIGPHRINVKLARALATIGVASFRFDLGGLGDSRPTNCQQNFLQQAVADLQAAMDVLQRDYGMRRFLLIGNCSGATHIYWAAQADTRVVGILMFDGFAYPTWWTVPIRYWKRVRAGQWPSIVTVAKRLLARTKALLGRLGRNDESEDVGAFWDDASHATPTRDAYALAMQSLADRGVAIFLVFSGGAIDGYSYRHQLRHGFGRHSFVKNVRCDLLHEVDHTLLSLKVQQRFIDVVCDWVANTARSGTASKLFDSGSLPSP